jgi:hypothetical protein
MSPEVILHYLYNRYANSQQFYDIAQKTFDMYLGDNFILTLLTIKKYSNEYMAEILDIFPRLQHLRMLYTTYEEEPIKNVASVCGKIGRYDDSDKFLHILVNLVHMILNNVDSNNIIRYLIKIYTIATVVDLNCNRYKIVLQFPRNEYVIKELIKFYQDSDRHRLSTIKYIAYIYKNETSVREHIDTYVDTGKLGYDAFSLLHRNYNCCINIRHLISCITHFVDYKRHRCNIHTILYYLNLTVKYIIANKNDLYFTENIDNDIITITKELCNTYGVDVNKITTAIDECKFKTCNKNYNVIVQKYLESLKKVSTIKAIKIE